MKAREIQGRHNDVSIVGVEPGSGSFQLCLVEERTYSSDDVIFIFRRDKVRSQSWRKRLEFLQYRTPNDNRKTKVMES